MIAKEPGYETANQRLERFVVGGFPVLEAWDGNVGSILPFIRFGQHNFGRLFCEWAHSRLKYSANARPLHVCIQEVDYLIRLAELKIRYDSLADTRFNVSELPDRGDALAFDQSIEPVFRGLAS